MERAMVLLWWTRGTKSVLFWDMVIASRGKYSSSKLDFKAEWIVPWCWDWGLTTTLVC